MISRRAVSRGRLFGLTLFALLGVACWLGCSRPEASQPEVIRPVRTTVVAAGEDTRIRSFPGRVLASRQADLAFQVSGLLTSLPVREGQRVAKGDVIAQLRQEEFQARLQALQGQLDQARAALAALQAGERPEERLRREAQLRASSARLANARTELERGERLLPSRAISQADFDILQTTYRIAQEEYEAARLLVEKGIIGRQEDIQAREGEVRGLEARVVEANIQLQDATLKAPYDGVVAQRFVEEGQNIRATEPVVRFQDAEEIDIAVDVPETVMIADIRTADILRLVAELSGAPGIEFPVELREIAQVADPVTQTFQVRVAMLAPPGIQALPGMTATVTATYRRASILGQRILVPISAIAKESTGEQIVWVIGNDQTAQRRPVRIGEPLGGEVVVVEGLQPGDRVATAGVSFLREGMRVRDLGDALGGA